MIKQEKRNQQHLWLIKQEKEIWHTTACLWYEWPHWKQKSIIPQQVYDMNVLMGNKCLTLNSKSVTRIIKCDAQRPVACCCFDWLRACALSPLDTVGGTQGWHKYYQTPTTHEENKCWAYSHTVLALGVMIQGGSAHLLFIDVPHAGSTLLSAPLSFTDIPHAGSTLRNVSAEYPIHMSETSMPYELDVLIGCVRWLMNFTTAWTRH